MKLFFAFLLVLLFLAACGRGGNNETPDTDDAPVIAQPNGPSGDAPMLGVAAPTDPTIHHEALPIPLPAPPVPYTSMVSMASQVLFAPQFSWAADFSHGMAAVLDEEGGVGIVGDAGEFVLPTIHSSVSPFFDGVAFVMRRGQDFSVAVDHTGQELFYLPPGMQVAAVNLDAPCEEGLFRTNQQIPGTGRLHMGMMDSAGWTVIENRFEMLDSFRSGRARARYNGLWGFIDIHGNFVIEPQFTAALDFANGVAIVEYGTGFERRLHSIDIYGNTVNEMSRGHQIARSLFTDGLLQFYTGAGAGFVNSLGEVIIPAMLRDPGVFSEGLLRARMMTDLNVGFVDTTGYWVVPPQFADARDFSNGRAAVARYDAQGRLRWGFIDTAGEVVIYPSFGWVGDFHEGFAVANRDAAVYHPAPDSAMWQTWFSPPFTVGGTYILIDRWGREVLDLSQFQRVGIVSEGILAVNEGWRLGGTTQSRYLADGGLWGYIKLVE